MKALVFAFLLFLNACASHEDRSQPANGEQLLEAFGLNQEEKDKFTFEEVAAPAMTPEPTPSAQVIESVVTRAAPTPTPTPVATPLTLPPEPPKAIWPPDYPQEFIALYEPAKATWQRFTPLIRVGESLSFAVSYLGIKAGTITFKVLENGKRGDDVVHHFKATLSSADYYKYIYRLDDYVESFILAESFMPLKYTLIQRESGQSVDELQLFDHETRQSKQWFKKVKDGNTRRDDKVSFVPPLFLDPLSLLSFFRGLPLEIGDEYFIPVIVRSKLWKITAKVEEREVIEALDVEHRAIKIRVHAESVEANKKPTTMNLWYSDDATRELLRFNAVLKFGSVEGELIGR